MTARRLPLVGAAVGAIVLMLTLGGTASSFGPTATSTWVASGGGNVVGATAVSGSTAYLGGNFSYVGPPTGSFVAADSAGTLRSSWPAVGGNVYAVAPDGANGFYIGGAFSSVGTRHANNLAHINSDGTLDTGWTGSTNGTVWALAVSGGTVYAGGSFTSADGVARTNLAAYSAANGALVTAFTSNATGNGAIVNTLEASGSVLYVGGFFTTLGGASHTNLGAVDTGTGTPTNWNASTVGSVYTLAVGGGVVYVGGSFTQVNGSTTRNRAAAFSVSNATLTSWNPGADGVVYALEYAGSTVYAGGAFGSIGGATRNAIAAVDSQNTGAATPWDPDVGATGLVDSLAVSGTTVYAGGSFNTVNSSIGRDNAAAFDITTGTATTFATAIGGTVFALAESGGNVGMGGEFRSAGAGGPTAGPVARSNLAAIDLTTGKATSWNPGTNDTVWVLALSGSTIYAGGAFTTVGTGLGRERLAAFTTAGVATSWNPGVHDGAVLALTIVGSTVYAGGTFTNVSSLPGVPPTVPRAFAAAFQANGQGNGFGDLTAWNPNPNGEVDALDAIGTTVFLGGAFTSLTPNQGAIQYNRNRLAAVNASGIPFNWNPNLDGSVFALTHVGTTVYAGGAFTVVNGNLARGGGAAFSAATGTATNWDPVTRLAGNQPGAIYSLAASASTMYIGGLFDSVGGPWTGGACTDFCIPSPSIGAVSLTDGFPYFSWAPVADDNVLTLALAPQGLVMGGFFTATGFPPAGLPVNANEPAAAYRGGFALVRALPDAPTNVTVTPGDTTATVTWQAPAYTGGGPITSYAISVDRVDGNPGGALITDATSPTTVTGLTNGVAYTFSVLAITSAGAGEAGAATATPQPVPGAPTGVTGTPGNGQASVSFTPPAPNGGPAITGYTVTAQPGNIVASGNSSPVTVGGLTNGQAYTFTVTATNAIGTSVASAPSSPVTPRTVPGAPTGVAATPGNGQATVSYTAPASNGGSAITLYTATSSPENLTGTSTDGSNIVVGGLTNGRTYVFTVTAQNVAGTGPTSTASSQVTPRTIPGAPTSVAATAGNLSASVSFAEPASDGGAPVTDYAVTSSPGGVTAHGSSSPVVVPGLTNGQAYTFTIVATNAAGPGAASSPSNAVVPGSPPTAPAAPTGAMATAGHGEATVSFIAPASDGGSAITGYTVTSSPGNVSVSGTTSPITVTGLTNGQSYTFTVKATNAVGTGSPSVPSSAVTPTAGTTVPGAPEGVTATAGNGQATVAFTAPASTGGPPITGYTVTSSPGGKTATGAVSPVIVTGLTNGAAYTFTVSATNAIGTGQPSSASNTVTPTFGPIPPGAPTGVTATAGNELVVVTFTPPASDGGAAITSYTVTSSPGNRSVSSTGSPVVVTGLANDQAYTFTVTATNSAGTGPASSVSAPAVPSQSPRQAAPNAPAPASRPAVPDFTAPAGPRPSPPGR